MSALAAWGGGCFYSLRTILTKGNIKAAVNASDVRSKDLRSKQNRRLDEPPALSGPDIRFAQ